MQDPLLWQNPETFEFEPYVATKWEIEDSVKLRPDFAGWERKIAIGSSEPATKRPVDVLKPLEGKDATPVVLTTFGPNGKPLGNAWLGLYPDDKSMEVQHLWTDEKGQIDVSGLPAGRYEARAGAEVVGDLKESGEGYELIPLTQNGTLDKPLTLKKEDVVDVQRRTVITYHLRDDVKWSDGVPFTSKDLAFAYRVISNPIVDGTDARSLYGDLVECAEGRPAYGANEIPQAVLSSVRGDGDALDLHAAVASVRAALQGDGQDADARPVG